METASTQAPGNIRDPGTLACQAQTGMPVYVRIPEASSWDLSHQRQGIARIRTYQQQKRMMAQSPEGQYSRREAKRRDARERSIDRYTPLCPSADSGLCDHVYSACFECSLCP